MKVTAYPDGSWSYFQDTVLQSQGQGGPFHHADENRLVKIGEPAPTPLAG